VNERELEELVEILYPFIEKRLNSSSGQKNVSRVRNASVVSIPETGTTLFKNIELKLLGDTETFTAKNQSGEELVEGDLVSFLSWIDLKNSIILSKVN
jgi:hypothetical protein